MKFFPNKITRIANAVFFCISCTKDDHNPDRKVDNKKYVKKKIKQSENSVKYQL